MSGRCSEPFGSATVTPKSMDVVMAAVSRRDDDESLREVLRYLAIRRWEHERRGRRLSKDITTAVAKASAAGIPRTEIAALLRMDRSAMYRTYVGLESSSAGPG